MREVKYFCDACGSSLTISEYKIFRISRGDIYDEWELCKKCLGELEEVIRKYYEKGRDGKESAKVKG